MAHILIFKTNVETEVAHKKVESVLKLQPYIIDWHIDHEDIDKILRIESTINNTSEIISTIKNAGFICEELPD